jgi:Fur family ferric uptake transcriptional regulator
MSELDRTAIKENFLRFLEQKNLRITSQRRAIVDTVFGTDQHFTAEQLLELAREKDPSVSRATVYRTLPLLTESGLVHEMDFGKDYKIYDPNYADHPNHNHIICNDCDKIVEFESERLNALENEISGKLGFEVESQQLRINASCEEMKRVGTCKKQGE